jgi:hypothetical protein
MHPAWLEDILIALNSGCFNKDKNNLPVGQVVKAALPPQPSSQYGTFAAARR